MLRRLLVFRIALWTMLSAIAGSSTHAAMILTCPPETSPTAGCQDRVLCLVKGR
jgi:hypothetical protein